jgi:hypothetical protein
MRFWSRTASPNWHDDAGVPLPTPRNLVQQFRLGHRLPDLRAAVGAFIGEVDFRHGQVRSNVLDVHRQAYAARADHEGRFGIVMMDIGWHVGSPQESIEAFTGALDPGASIRPRHCHNYDFLRTQEEQPHNPDDCGRSVRPWPLRHNDQFSSREGGLPRPRFKVAVSFDGAIHARCDRVARRANRVDVTQLRQSANPHVAPKTWGRAIVLRGPKPVTRGWGSGPAS